MSPIVTIMEVFFLRNQMGPNSPSRPPFSRILNPRPAHDESQRAMRSRTFLLNTTLLSHAIVIFRSFQARPGLRPARRIAQLALKPPANRMHWIAFSTPTNPPVRAEVTKMSVTYHLAYLGGGVDMGKICRAWYGGWGLANSVIILLFQP